MAIHLTPSGPQELVSKAPKLAEWFYEMFRYAAESEAASRIVEDLLGPSGPFHDDGVLKTRTGQPFFLALTEASPESGSEMFDENNENLE